MRVCGWLLLAATCGWAGESEVPAAGPVVRDGAFWSGRQSSTIPAGNLSRVRIVTTGDVSLYGQRMSRITYTLTVRAAGASAQAAEEYQFRKVAIRSTRDRDGLVLAITVPRMLGAEPSKLAIGVPADLQQVMVRTREGDVQASGLAGAIDVETGAGSIALDRIGSSALAKTSGGEIRIGHVAGPVNCRSGGGSIHAESVGPDSWLGTAGGDIRIERADGALHVETGGGNIHVKRVSGPAYARTAGGIVAVGAAAGPVVAETNGGAIQISSAASIRCRAHSGAIKLRNGGGAVHAATSAGSIIAELLPGASLESSAISTAAGDITVFLPSKLRVTVQARNGSPDSASGIVSEFPEIRVKRAGADGSVMAEGARNGGGPLLRISVDGGSIFLRRRKETRE